MLLKITVVYTSLFYFIYLIFGILKNTYSLKTCRFVKTDKIWKGIHGN